MIDGVNGALAHLVIEGLDANHFRYYQRSTVEKCIAGNEETILQNIQRKKDIDGARVERLVQTQQQGFP